MSRPRYNWWPFALNMVRDYPYRKREFDALHEQKITASATGLPGGGGSSRTVEQIAMRQLPKQEQKEYDTVHQAVQRTRQMKDGEYRLQVVKLTLWQNRYTIPGAAMRLNIPEDRAKQYRWEFIVLVGHLYGFLSKQDYEEIIGRKKKSSPPRA